MLVMKEFFRFRIEIDNQLDGAVGQELLARVFGVVAGYKPNVLDKL